MSRTKIAAEKPKIVGIELTPLQIPFKQMVREAMRQAGGLGMAIAAEEDWPGGDFAVCKMTDEAGNTGLGEQFVWWPETGVSPSQIILAVQEALYKYVLGRSPFDYQDMRIHMNNNVARNETAKGLLDMACWDLMGRQRNKAACELMGGKQTNELELGALVPLMTAREMAGMAGGWQQVGYNTVRLKLGRNAEDDTEIVRMVRERLGKEGPYKGRL